MKRLLAIILSLIMMTAFVGCGQRGTDLEEIQKAGKIIVGVTEYEPMNFKINGEWTGFDTEFAQLFAKSLGVEVEFVEIVWKDRYTLLKEYDIDCIFNGMTINYRQQQSISVSDPYLKNAQVLVMKADRVGDHQDGYEVAKLTFAVEAGSEAELCSMIEAHKNTISTDTQEAALKSVSEGKADAAIVDIVMANALTGKGKKYDDLYKGFEYSSENFGVGFRKNSDLVNEFNEFLKEIKDEELLELANKYGLTLS